MTKSTEEIIREAMQRGEFDNLKNKGQPLNLDAYFDTPEELRMAYSILKNADVVPLEVQMLREIEALQEKQKQSKSDEERKKLQNEIEDRRLKYNLMVERFKPRRG